MRSAIRSQKDELVCLMPSRLCIPIEPRKRADFPTPRRPRTVARLTLTRQTTPSTASGARALPEGEST
ncbi:hypothetical protein C8Q77DRAFT_1078841 [Trametes polyzona]|nr:hypothetical protein C8Q77DRAFT_1078841 [Trametes polyzona]